MMEEFVVKCRTIVFDLPEGQHRESVVGFSLKNSLVSFIAEFPSGISQRTMSCRIKLTKDGFLTVVSIYKPTMSHFDEAVGQFYDDLVQLLRKVPISNKLVILGDFNARVGNDYISWQT
uniref:Endonuclease/exonuclease/phosphatase domain-containing protein n=1 Tax=Octopus bimaculoides TaxID=37653 RepID=A0A0L8HS95_OCTBM